MCQSCQALMINGVRCHEAGCPDAWRDYKRTCKWCGSTFVPEEQCQECCEESCWRAYAELPSPEDDIEGDWLDDDRDQENPCEYSEGYDWAGRDFDNDPEWR